MEDFKNLIKLDLHCHLDGSLNVDSVFEVLEKQDSHYEKEELIRKLKVAPDCTSLTEYLEKFDLPLQCLQTAEGLKRAAYELVRDAAQENVRYIEVRFAPMLSVNAGLNCKKVLESVIEGLESAGKQYGVYASAIVCAMRHHSLEQNMEMMRVAREFLGDGACALDLAGDESGFPTHLFRELFLEARRLEMPFTIHSGECGSVENVKEAIDLGAKRLGHGIALQKSLELQKLCADKRIGIEMCPTSNLQTKAINSFDEYPLGQFVKNGLLVSINTDNRTVSGTTITQEMQIVRDVLGLGKDVILQCTKNAIETAFADDSVKHELYKEIS
ncbi:MAG: adenosine deaminase [Tyzzerella sp.]|nr:adenosine deaminase [Tyzzerella sp.]